MAQLPDLTDGSIIYAADINDRYSEVYNWNDTVEAGGNDLDNLGDLTFDTGKGIIQDAWATLTPLNGWSHSSTQLQYRLDKEGRVWIRGAVTGGTITDGTAVAQLPAGFRPTSTNKALTVGAVMAGGTGNSPQVNIITNGNITLVGIGSNAYVNIYGAFWID